MSENKLVEIIIEQLTKFDIKNIYSYAGDTTLRFFSALKDSPIKLYTVKHESVAGFMASAEAKLNGRLAVCVSHSGPGTANIINGIADAYSDRAPVLLISGQVPTYNIGTDYKQYLDLQKLSDPLTVYSSIVLNPASIVDQLYKAMTMAISRGGVSHLVIPMDMWEQESTAVPREYPEHLNFKPIPDQETINKSAEIINKSGKICIIYGRGVENTRDELIKLSQKINGALINSLPAAHLIKFENPFSLGGLGLSGSEEATQLLNEAELIVILGTNWWPMDYTPRNPVIIQIDACRENIGATHPVNVGLWGDMKKTLSLLIDRVKDKDNKDWINRINEARKAWFDNLNKEEISNSQSLMPKSIIEAISENTGENEIITLDSGDNVIWFGKHFANSCSSILLSGTWRTMGFSLPAALAAKINRPESPVTSINGDGGLIMVLSELLTAVRYKIPVRILVLNNGTLAMEKNRMINANIPIKGVDLNNPDFIKIAEACGLNGIRVNSVDHLNQILKDTQNISEPVLIDIPTANPIPPGTKL